MSLDTRDGLTVVEEVPALLQEPLAPVLLPSVIESPPILAYRPEATLNRYEIKFLITDHVRTAMLPQILTHMRPDHHGIRGKYEIFSLYFDTPDFAAYHEKKIGVFRRAKLRMRHYGKKGGPVFLEIKERLGNHVVKHRHSLDMDSREGVLQGRPLSSDYHSAQVYNSEVQRRQWRPKMMVKYKREAYVSTLPGKLRVTFDTDVAARLSRRLEEGGAPYFKLLSRQWTVLEIKFDGIMPQWISDMVARYSLQNQSVSKYCNGIDRLLRMGRMGDAACD